MWMNLEDSMLGERSQPQKVHTVRSPAYKLLLTGKSRDRRQPSGGWVRERR